jgi:DNA-binding XRE family transcriptional regulator
MADTLSFASKLKTYRRMRGWTCGKAGQKSGMSEEQYRNVEEGIHEPLAGTWNKILCGFDLDPSAFPPEDFKQVTL